MKPTPSLHPQAIDKERWYYYEYQNNLTVCTWQDGKYFEVKIPWPKILKSAKRCGKI